MQENIYLKADKNVIVGQRNVTMGDVLKIECSDIGTLRKVKQIKLHTFPSDAKKKSAKRQTQVFSILKIVQMIHEDYPSANITCLGEADFVVEYVPEEAPTPIWDVCKLILVCILVFLGAAFTIMGFNNDISVTEVFEQFYDQLVGGEKPPVSELEIFYSIGLSIGILVFFNHFGKKKITSDPTPIQVEMRKYEEDIDTTLIENAGRKGHSKDVD